MEEKRPRGRPKGIGVRRMKRSTTFPPALYEKLKSIAERKQCDVNDLIVTGAWKVVQEEERLGNTKPAFSPA